MAKKDYSRTPLTTKLGAKAGADGLWIAYPKKTCFVYRREDR